MGAKAVAEQYRRAGCRYIAVASMADEDRPNGANFEKAAAEIAELAEACKAEAVQVIGTKFVLYKRNEKEPKIVLVKDKKK